MLLLGVFALIAFVWRRLRPTRYTLLGRVAAPGPGSPNTTLLITDIQNSTRLWEDLSVLVRRDPVSMHLRYLVVSAKLYTYSGWDPLDVIREKSSSLLNNQNPKTLKPLER
jgi:class 3 adenylate cyclase